MIKLTSTNRRVPARCNKRACQARRNLSKMPDRYVRHPKCHIAGCDGLMYVDKYRLRKGPHDNAPTCHDTCLLDWAQEHDKFNPQHYPHRYSDKRCKHYEEWVIECSVRASKHSPIKPETEEQAPF